MWRTIFSKFLSSIAGRGAEFGTLCKKAYSLGISCQLLNILISLLNFLLSVSQTCNESLSIPNIFATGIVDCFFAQPSNYFIYCFPSFPTIFSIAFQPILIVCISGQFYFRCDFAPYISIFCFYGNIIRVLLVPFP